MKALLVGLAGTVALALTGCGSSLPQPFDALKKDNAPMTVLHVQNYEPPAAAAASPTGFQVPPQIQQWITMGASLLPPGLLPPGIIPGAQQQQQQAQVPRFHDARILRTVNVADRSIHDEMIDILATESNFETPKETCLYPEFGVAIAQMNQPPADVLISMSCAQVRAFGFVWPHGAKTGLKPDTIKKIAGVMSKTLGGG